MNAEVPQFATPPPWSRLKLAAGKAASFGAMSLKGLRHPFVGSISPDLREPLRLLRRDGVARIPGFFDEEFCAKAVQEIEGSLEDPTIPREVDPVASDHRLWALDRLHPNGRAKILAEREDLRGLASEFLRTPAEVAFVMGARLVARPRNLGSGGGWHRDTEEGHQFKAIVYLTDVGLENGPYQYLLGTNRGTSMMASTLSFGVRKRYSDSEVRRMLEGGARLQTFCGSAGTVLFTDTLGIHRGAPIQGGQRLALTTYVSPRHSLSDFLAAFTGVIPAVYHRSRHDVKPNGVIES